MEQTNVNPEVSTSVDLPEAQGAGQSQTPAAVAAPAPAAEAPEQVSHTLQEWEAEIAAAEQRGYIRGRNEAIDASAPTSALYEMPAATPRRRPVSPLLGHVRPSVWDL